MKNKDKNTEDADGKMDNIKENEQQKLSIFF